MDYLQQHPPEQCNSVIDVGCGWGISGIWCAQNLQADVTSVDADPNVYPYLDTVAQLNGVSTTPLVSRFEDLSVSQLAKFDMLIAADICFWDELAEPVSKLVDRAVEAGVKRILIADPERAPFFVVADHCTKAHYAELFNWQLESDTIKAQGALLLIENA
jgi:predicted nicotinamide N-methyase